MYLIQVFSVYKTWNDNYFNLCTHIYSRLYFAITFSWLKVNSWIFRIVFDLIVVCKIKYLLYSGACFKISRHVNEKLFRSSWINKLFLHWNIHTTMLHIIHVCKTKSVSFLKLIFLLSSILLPEISSEYIVIKIRYSVWSLSSHKRSNCYNGNMLHVQKRFIFWR